MATTQKMINAEGNRYGNYPDIGITYFKHELKYHIAIYRMYAFCNVN